MPVPGIHNSLVLKRTGFPIEPGMTRRQEFDFLECIKINDGSVSHNIYIFMSYLISVSTLKGHGKSNNNNQDTDLRHHAG